MPGSMSRADLIASLRAMLGDAANKFTDTDHGDLGVIIDRALLDFSRKRPLQRVGSIALVAEQADYTTAEGLPADIIGITRFLWGDQARLTRKPWDFDYPAPPPRGEVLDDGAGGRLLKLSPAPTSAQIADLGAACKFTYRALHQVAATASATTVRPEHRHLLLTRALAEALFDIATHQANKPVSLGPGVGGMPRNGSAAALADAAMARFEQMAA